jgi:N-acylglucosamine-6-phosphate 2-epimerase
MSMAAARSGAAGVRVNGVGNIMAVSKRLEIPIIGIEKLYSPSSRVYITPTYESVRRVCRAGADIVALDCTGRRRPMAASLAEILERAKHEYDGVIMADVATLAQGHRAAELGVHVVATTLYGYTEDTRGCEGPPLKLLQNLVRELDIPVILEGWVRTPSEVKRAFDLGAHAVVVGTAITGIEFLVEHFLIAVPRGKRRERRAYFD